MSKFLDALIEQRRKGMLSYKEYLEKIAQLTREATMPGGGPGGYPASVKTAAQRALFNNKELIPPLLEKWQKRLRVKVAGWDIKRMRTKWGSCNPSARRVWFNLELAKKPEMCLEYIVVHELAHLLERHHNERFTALLEKHMPQWRLYRDMLARLPLAHEDWRY